MHQSVIWKYNASEIERMENTVQICYAPIIDVPQI